jgi:hypothetical protein
VQLDHGSMWYYQFASASPKAMMTPSGLTERATLNP